MGWGLPQLPAGWKPPKPKYPAGGTMQDYGEGNPFGVGAAPGPSQGWNYGGGMFGGGGDQGPSFGEMRDVFNQTTDDVRGQLGGNVDLGRFGALGGAIMGGITNPQGFGDDVLTRMRTGAGEREAGLRESLLRGLQNRAGATGFGRSASALGVGADIRGQSAQRLAQANLGIDTEDARMKRQSQADMIRAALGLTGEERGYRSQLADFFANVQRPVGGGPGGGGGEPLPGAAEGYRFINDRGEPLPFHPDGTPLTDAEWQEAFKERQRFLNGGG